MFFLRLLRLLTGYVRFRAYGGFGERFLNLCTLHRIPLWDVQANGSEIIACTSIDGYRRIFACAKKSGMRTRMLRQAGLPFFLFRFRGRAGLLIGAVFCLLCLAFLSGRIWVVTVSGNVTVPDDAVLAAAEQAGVRIGCRKSKLNAAQSAIETESAFDSVSHVSINVTGSCAQIIVKESARQPAVTNTDGLFDLIAAADAQLVVLEPYSGTAQVRRFDSVVKGQTLISGIWQNRDESVTYLHADGYAVGRTEKELSAYSAAKETANRFRQIKTVYRLFLFGIEIPLGRAPHNFDFACAIQKRLAFNGTAMPVGIFCTRYAALTPAKRTARTGECRKIAIARYMRQAEHYAETRQKITEHIRETADQAGVRITGTLACYENIGEARAFRIYETGQTESNRSED